MKKYDVNINMELVNYQRFQSKDLTINDLWALAKKLRDFTDRCEDFGLYFYKAMKDDSLPYNIMEAIENADDRRYEMQKVAEEAYDAIQAALTAYSDVESNLSFVFGYAAEKLGRAV